MRPNQAYNHPVSNPKHYYGFNHLHYLTKSAYRGLAQSATLRSLFIPAPRNAVGAVREPPLQPYVSAAGQTRADSPLRWGEGVGQALLPVSKAGAWRASSQAGVPAPPHQPEPEG